MLRGLTLALLLATARPEPEDSRELCCLPDTHGCSDLRDEKKLCSAFLAEAECHKQRIGTRPCVWLAGKCNKGWTNGAGHSPACPGLTLDARRSALPAKAPTPAVDAAPVAPQPKRERRPAGTPPLPATSLAQPPPPPPPPVVEGCKPWCLTHTSEWKHKCVWKPCQLCSACLALLPASTPELPIARETQTSSSRLQGTSAASTAAEPAAGAWGPAGGAAEARKPTVPRSRPQEDLAASTAAEPAAGAWGPSGGAAEARKPTVPRSRPQEAAAAAAAEPAARDVPGTAPSAEVPLAPKPATPHSKPKDAASRAAAEPAAEDRSGADAAPSALDAIPKPSSPMTPTQRISWLREYVNVSTLTTRAASILEDDGKMAEGDDFKAPPTPKQRLHWLRQHITAANLTKWVSGSISGVNVSAIAAPPTGLFRRAFASVRGGWDHAGGARGLLSRLGKSMPHSWVAAWRSVRGRVESRWARVPKGLRWALGLLALLACCGGCCCCLRACVRRHRKRKLHATYTAVESDPFINDDGEDGLQSGEISRLY